MRKYIPILLIILALTARLLPGLRTIDDSYITFRYARNILAGNGFVFNPGDRVLGTTTPLYTLLMTGLGLFAGGKEAPFPLIAFLVNAVFDAVTCVLLYQIGKHLHYEVAGTITGLAWAIAPFSVTFAIGGLETSLYVLLLVSTSYFYLNRNHPISSLLAALAFLTRPDALILIALLGIHRIYLWWKGEQLRIAEIVFFCLPVLTWLIFAWCYFGSPIPHSILAKSLAYRLPQSAAFIRLIQHYANPFFEAETFGVFSIWVGLFLYPFLYLIGSRQAIRKVPSILPIAIFPWFYFAIFVIANPLIFRWYLTPPLPFYFLFIFIGLENFLEKVLIPPLERLRKLSSDHFLLQRRIPQIILFGLPILLSLLAWTWKPDHGPQTPAPEMAWVKLELTYQSAAARVSPLLRSGDVLASGDVGVLGYLTDARILDTVGLNSISPVSYYPLPQSDYVINYAIPPDLIMDEKPAFIIFPEVYGRNGLLKDPRFINSYKLLEKIPTDIYGSDGMLIYSRIVTHG